jgi:UDP-N-acetylglucosamine 2-epimerase
VRKRNVSVVFGTRPEAIKLAPVIRCLNDTASLTCTVCVTAQHRELLDEVLEVFSIEPDVDLDLMRPGQDLPGLTARALLALGDSFERSRPDLVLIQGDTTTTFCAALAAFYAGIPVGHVEAGLRTHDLGAPWPEEANRVMTSRLATLHFAATEWNRDNLVREGVDEASIFVTGNPVIDALHDVLRMQDADPGRDPGLGETIVPVDSAEPLVLITAHRRESFGQPLEHVCTAISVLASEFSDHRFVFAVHPNPNVQQTVRAHLGHSEAANVTLTEPLSYRNFARLMAASRLIVTDSGGIQEEAPSLGVPVLVVRRSTERPEGIEAGSVKLVGTDPDRIVETARDVLSGGAEYQRMARARNPYGDGNASRRIVERCVAFLDG